MRTRSVFRCAMAVALACLLTCPLAMLAQRRSSAWESEVRVKLAAVALLLNFVDAHRTYDPYIGMLGDDRYTDLTLLCTKAWTIS
jgi:hypothetical protein